MTSPVGLLDFFILEAGDSIDRLDAAISGAATSAPDIDVLLRHSRTLRGSSTMARQNGMAEVAAGIERVARALRDGESDVEPGAARGARRGRRRPEAARSLGAQLEHSR